MKKFFDNVITYILVLMIMAIVLGTVYFCLDVFGVVAVPEQLSLATILYSKFDAYANSEEFGVAIPAGESKVSNDVDKQQVIDISKENNTNNNKNEVEKPKDEDALSKLNVLNTTTMEEPQVIDAGEEPRQSLNTIASNRLYYSQLDDYGKKIYDEMYRYKTQLKSGTYTADFKDEFNALLHEEGGSDTLNSAFQYSINALTFDNPDLFYVDVTKLYLLTEITTRAFSKSYRVQIGMNEEKYLTDDFTSATSVDEGIANVEAVRDSLVEQCQGLDQVSQIKLVHDYLVDTVEYDSSAGTNVYNVYGALVNRRAVCEGYARAFKYILDELKIPCVIACGIATNSEGATESHAWNYVYIKGEWYAIDVTWDDPIIRGYGTVTNKIRYAYFLKGSEEFFKDHAEDGNIVSDANFKYPTISKVDYNW